jgi:hypothetical protein
MLCGSIWSCPSCSAKIRQTRARDISRAVSRHVEAGGSAYMVTLTARHRRYHDLAPLFDAVANGFTRLIAGRAWLAERKALGVVGTIRSIEVTWSSAKGWHPHLHVLVLTDGTPDPATLARAIDRWQRVWTGWTARHGYEASMQYGVTWTPVTSAAEAAEYVVKLQDGRDPGLEVARGDLKAGRLGSVTPFEILDYFARTGDADALELWNRYEVVSKHRLHHVVERPALAAAPG